MDLGDIDFKKPVEKMTDEELTLILKYDKLSLQCTSKRQQINHYILSGKPQVNLNKNDDYAKKLEACQKAEVYVSDKDILDALKEIDDPKTQQDELFIHTNDKMQSLYGNNKTTSSNKNAEDERTK